MPDEVQSISRLTNPEDGTTTLVVGTHRPSLGTGHLFVGETTFTEINSGFGVEPFSMVAWHPFLDQTAWMYVTDDVQSRRTDVPGNDVKVGIPRPNRHGASLEFVSIIQPTVDAVAALTIYDLATGDDVTAAADWASNWRDFLVTGDTQTISVEKLSQVAVGGSLNAVTGYALQDPPAAGTEFARSTVAVMGRIFDIFGPQELDLETDFSNDSRIEMFIKLGDVVKVDFVRLQFTMETPQTGMTYAASGGAFSEVIVTQVAHGYQTGDAILFQGITGSPITSTINGYWLIRRATDDTFQLDESSFDGTPVGGTMVSLSANSYYTDFTTDQLSVGSTFTVDFATSAAQNTADETKLRAEYEQWLIDHDFPVGGAPGPTISELLRAQGDAGFRFWIGNKRGDFFGIIPGGQKITSNEWFGVSIPKSTWFRGGTNPLKTWKNITGMIIGARYSGEKIGGGDNVGDHLAFAQIDIVGTESQLNSKLGGLPYDWRYTYYESETGVESNGSPIMAEGIDAVNQPVTITMTGIDTGIADKIRLYRRGAMLRDWHLVDTIVNPGATTTTYVDGKSDIDIIGNQLLQLDNYPPLPLPVQVTQLLRFSERFSSATWVKSNATITPNVIESPRGSNTADLLTDDGSGGGGISQTITDPGKTTYFSIFVKARTITGGGPHISLTNDVDAAIPITLTLPNNRPAEGGRIGAWQRVVMTCSTGITSVGITVTNADDKIWIWGAQLDDWDALTGFLPPARHVADLEDTTALEVLAARQQSLLTPSTRAQSFEEGNRFIGTGVVDDTTTVLTTILEDGGPPQVWWGPWQGNVMFAIRGHKDGEVIDAGSVYWCKAGQPDAWSPFKRLPVTHSGEPLKNGFLYNTHSFTWSAENLYRIDPDPTGRGEFVSWPTPVGRGLSFPWAFAVGPKIWFLSAGGIYETTGGPARNITAGSLIRPLFEGQTINGMPGVDLAGADDDEMRMEFNGVYLYFMYKNIAGNRAVLRWHHIFERWEHFTHFDPVRMGLNEQEAQRLIYGTNNGFITLPGGGDDHGNDIGGFFRTGSLDLGTPQLEKIFGDVHIEATIPIGVTVTVQPFFNDEDSSGATQNLVGTGARVRYKLTLGDDVRARSIAFEVAGIEAGTAIHEIAVSYQLDQIAELQWDSYFEDDGSLEDKWISGLYLEVDTGGVNKDIAVFVDGVEISAEGSPFTINTPDRQPVRISFEAPVRGQQMRFTSSTVAGKLFDWRWIWVPQPVVLEEPFAWDNLSSNLEKFVKGFTIDADTLNQPVTLQLRINGNETANPLGAEEFTFTHDGRQQSQFAFDFSGANQILVEVVRLANTTSNPLQVHNLTWIFDTEPPHKDRWNTQDRSFNLPGWGLLRDGYIAIRSIADVTLTVTIDGVAQTPITLPNTTGDRRKLYVQYEANKGKVFQFTLTSASDFKVYNEDTNIWVKAWNTNVGYKQFQLPFEGGIPNP